MRLCYSRGTIYFDGHDIVLLCKKRQNKIKINNTIYATDSAAAITCTRNACISA